MLNRILPALVLLLAIMAHATPAPAQVRLPAAPQTAGTAPEIPADLTPEMVDAMMARLTDAEIRALLREELRRRADERAAAMAAQDQTLVTIRMRLTEMAGRIETRVTRWVKAIANIGQRRDKVAAKLARAGSGVGGMVLASLAVLVSGVAAALLIGWITRAWRGWLAAPHAGAARGRGYWDRVVRTIALGALEFAPIFAFVFATVSTAPMVSGALGPMVDYVWIYHVGVSYGWGFIVIARRAFAPDTPAIRINHLTDEATTQIYTLVRRAVLIGAGGWLIAGLSPTLGLGFPPALVTVALAGTAVAVLLIVAAIRNHNRIRAGVADAVTSGGSEPGTLARMAIAMAPAALIAYLVIAWLYWLAHWLERGQQRLDGPAGTLVLLLVLPILDRLGAELCHSLVRTDTALADRFRSVLHGIWRMLIGIVSVFVISGLWGLDLYGLAKGDMAPRWADTGFDIAATLLVAHIVWRLILAALHHERTEISGGGEDVSEIEAASRLDTLIPLLRNVLLTMLAVVVVMILLASAGVDIGPLLASAGIIGIAVGFGAQALVRDIFSGAFFLIDDAFRVGEYIELDKDMRGEVEAISIRSLQLRHHKGAVITIPFGEMKHITNHNRDWVIYKMMFRMEPDVDPQKVKKIVKEIGKEFLAHPEHGPKFIEPLKSQGVYMIDDDSAQVFRVKFKCKPRAQFVLRREIYHRLREVFAQNGIGFARRKVEVVSTDGTDVGGLPEEVLTNPPPAPV